MGPRHPSKTTSETPDTSGVSESAAAGMGRALGRTEVVCRLVEEEELGRPHHAPRDRELFERGIDQLDYCDRFWRTIAPA